MIAEDDVRYVARLARLHLEQDEVDRMTGELVKILGHIDKMSELDTATVLPTAHVLDIVNVMRADKPRSGSSREDALRNAPAVGNDSFRVPRMT